MITKGAMATNPPKTTQQSPQQLGLTRLSPGVFRDKQGNLTDSRGRITRRASQPSAQKPKPTTPPPVGTTPPPIPAPGTETPATEVQDTPIAQIPDSPQITAPTPPPSLTGAPAAETPKDAPIFTAENLFKSAGDFYGNYDPTKIGSMVQPQFTQQMQEAGNSIYDEFSRRAEPEFERQRAALEQQMYERGLDPNSQGARLQMDQLMQQQNDARQSIRNQATQQSMAYQQQLFNQGQSIFGQPADIASKLSAPYLESMRLQGEATARKENLANDLTKLATQFSNDEKILAQDIAGKLQIGNFDLEADLKKLRESSNNTVRELAVQLENDLAKIKAGGAVDARNLKIQGQTQTRVAGIGAGASVRAAQLGADASTFDTIMRAYNPTGGGEGTSGYNKAMEKALEILGPAVVKAITGG